jgi:RNA polymerase sigma factor (sigma-70 family)
MRKSETIELARKAQKGDKVAFEELCRSKQRVILFTAMTMLKNNEDAEDATQETILIMFRHLDQLKSLDAIDAWILKIVRNRCIEILRKRSKRYTEDDIDDETVNVAEENREFLPEAYAEDKALSDRLYEIVCTLPEKRREAVLMYYYDDLSYKEIAKITGTSIKTVSTNLMKARKMIKDKLNIMEVNVGMFGVASSSTVMGRVLTDQAAKRITDAQLASIEEKWSEQFSNWLPAKVLRRELSINVVLVALITITVFLGATFFIIYNGSESNDISSVPVLVSGQGDRKIAFSGNDCDCGHINPQDISAAGLEVGDRDFAWDILTDDDDRLVLATGNATDITQKVLVMIENGQDGNYIVRCKLYDRNDNSISMTRSFTIGNFKGDVKQ